MSSRFGDGWRVTGPLRDLRAIVKSTQGALLVPGPSLEQLMVTCSSEFRLFAALCSQCAFTRLHVYSHTLTQSDKVPLTKATDSILDSRTASWPSHPLDYDIHKVLKTWLLYPVHLSTTMSSPMLPTVKFFLHHLFFVHMNRCLKCRFLGRQVDGSMP